MQTFQKNILLKNQFGTQTRKISAVHFLCMFLMIVILVSCKSNKNVVSTNISPSSPEAVKTENRIEVHYVFVFRCSPVDNDKNNIPASRLIYKFSNSGSASKRILFI